MAKAIKGYKTLQDELEAILAELQDPKTDVDKALELYKRGQETVRALQQYLAQAGNTVRKLTPKQPEG